MPSLRRLTRSRSFSTWSMVPTRRFACSIGRRWRSYRRLEGARGILQGLLDRGAIGLATTHDLALTKMVEALGARAVNVHFEDRFENGVLTFDYRLKPGVVQTSNALALMRAVGLDV